MLYIEIMSLLAAAALTLNLPKPANFECDLLLISTSRNIAEWDPEMTWLRAESEPKLSSKKVDASQEGDVTSARVAIRENANGKTPVVVMDGAALKTNLYNPTRSKMLNTMSSRMNWSTGKVIAGYQATSVPVSPTGGLYLGFSLGRGSGAIGPAPSPKETWPTFCALPIVQQLGGAYYNFPDQVRAAANRNLALNFSTLSVAETAQQIDQSDPNYKQICICAWGTQIPGRPNIIAFPPNGRAVRYKFGHKDGKWYANFVKAY